MFFKRYAAAAAAALALSTTIIALPSLADTKPAKHTTVMIKFVPLRNHGVPLVLVKVNDQVTGTFMIDTGAGGCIMSRKFADKLGLKTQPATIGGVLPFGFGDDPEQKQAADVKELQLGNLRLTGGSFIVVKDDELFRFAEQPVDGIIGGPILSQFAMFVDFPRRFIALISPGNLSDQERANIQLVGVPAIPLKEEEAAGVIEESTAVVDASVGGHAEAGPADVQPTTGIVAYHVHVEDYTYSTPVELKNGAKSTKTDITIDTGAPTTSIPLSASDKIAPGVADFESASTMYNGSSIYRLGTVEEMTLPGLTAYNFKVAYPSDKDSDIPPLLGEDVLSYGIALFDFPARKLYFKPTLPPLLTGTVSVDPSHVNVQRLQDAATDIWLFPSESLATDTAFDEDDIVGAVAAKQAKMKGDSSDAGLYMQLATYYHNDKQDSQATAAYAKAAELLQAQVKAKPQDAKAQAQLAESIARTGKLDDAEKVARQAVAQAPNEPLTWVALGRVLQSKAQHAISGGIYAPRTGEGDYSEYLTLVATLQATPPSAAQTDLVKQTVAEARSAFEKAVALAPTDSKVYKARAAFLEETAIGIDLPLRDARGEKVNLLHDEHTDAYFADMDKVGELSNEPSDIDESINADVEQAVLRPHSHVDYRETKFWKSLPQDTRQKITDSMARLTSLSKSTDVATATKAQAILASVQYSVMFDRADSESALKSLIAAHPDSGEAVETYAVILSNDSRYDDLAAVLAAAEKTKPTAQLHLMLARTDIRQQKFDDAEAEARSALKMKPESFQCNLLLASLLLHKATTSDTLSEAKACLDKAQAAMGNAPDQESAAEYGTERGIYLAMSGDPTGSAQALLAVLAKERTDTQARDALAALMI